MTHTRTLIAASSALAVVLAGCNDPATGASAPTAQRQYGVAQQVGNGTVRTYIQFGTDGTTPIEVGVAMSERAMDGLPAPSAPSAAMKDMPAGAHAMMDMNMYLLDLPAQNPTPYRFVQFDWNPSGHEPAGVYDKPHFDFHFYTVSRSARDGILPTDPQYATKAASFPGAEFRAPFYIDAATPAGAPAAAVAVPQMGLHWLDVRSPELQGMTGHPESFKPFTTTFIYGSWDGQFIFDEPMITRAYILAKHDATDAAVRDEIIPVSTPTRQSAAGYHPKAYRITWDAQAKEYRVALTQLAKWN